MSDIQGSGALRGMSRRRFLGVLGATTGLAATAGVAGCGINLRGGQTAELTRSQLPPPKPFTVPLPMPPVKKPVRTDTTTDYYEIVQRHAEAEILPGTRTPIFGYDGIFPGPTIESRSGRRTVVRHVNELRVPTVVHLHGGRTPPDSDGYPTDLVLPDGPGARKEFVDYPGGLVETGHRDYVYPLKQRASILWYHDHRMDFSGPQVYRGLAGFHLVRDDEEAALPLPRGQRDIPLMIVDRAFTADGAFRYPSRDPSLRHPPGVTGNYMEGVLGDVILVNGAPWPVLEVDTARYRLRILNASNARRYRLALDPPPAGASAPFTQIGSDGGLLARPVRHQAIDVAPAERFDVVVDFSGTRVGDQITLVNRLGTGSTARVMRFRVTRTIRDDDSQVTDRLAEIEPLDPDRATVHRNWTFTRGDVHGKPGWVINGKPFDPNRMDARPRLGEVEVWRFYTDLHHPVHIHLSPFQVLSRGTGPPGPYDHGWKDVIDLRPTEAAEVAVRFTGYHGRYLLHCHNLEHEDIGAAREGWRPRLAGCC